MLFKLHILPASRRNKEPLTMAKKPNTLAAIDSANKDLETARSRVLAATADLKTRRAILSKAILDWQGAVPPRDFATVHREHLQRQTEYAAKVRAGEIIEHKPVEVAPTWPIEIALRAGKKSLTQNYKRPRAGLRA
jgi:hypothetical protein